MRRRRKGLTVWCVGSVVVLLAAVAAGEAATGGWKAKLLQVTEKYYFGEKPKAPAGPKLPCPDPPPKPQLKDVVDMEDWVAFLSRTLPFPDKELTYEALAARILPQYGDLDAFLVLLVEEVGRGGSYEQLRRRAYALATLYDTLPDAPEHKEHDAHLLVTLFEACGSTLRVDPTFFSVWFGSLYGRLFCAMEKKRFPVGMSEEDLSVLRTAIQGIDERACWRPIVDYYAEEYERSVDLAKQGHHEEIIETLRSPQPRAWYAAPVRFYEGWRVSRLISQMKEGYGKSYVDFVNSNGFHRWGETERWLPSRLLASFVICRDQLARSESLNNVLLAAIDADLALRAGQPYEEAAALVAAYTDGDYGAPLRLKQDGDMNVITWRFTDIYGNYEDSATYTWPAR